MACSPGRDASFALIVVVPAKVLGYLGWAEREADSRSVANASCHRAVAGAASKKCSISAHGGHSAQRRAAGEGEGVRGSSDKSKAKNGKF